MPETEGRGCIHESGDGGPAPGAKPIGGGGSKAGTTGTGEAMTARMSPGRKRTRIAADRILGDRTLRCPP